MRMSVDLPAPGPRGPTCKTEDSSIWGSRTECHWHSVRLNGGGSTLALAWMGHSDTGSAAARLELDSEVHHDSDQDWRQILLEGQGFLSLFDRLSASGTVTRQ